MLAPISHEAARQPRRARRSSAAANPWAHACDWHSKRAVRWFRSILIAMGMLGAQAQAQVLLDASYSATTLLSGPQTGLFTWQLTETDPPESPLIGTARLHAQGFGRTVVDSTWGGWCDSPQQFLCNALVTIEHGGQSFTWGPGWLGATSNFDISSTFAGLSTSGPWNLTLLVLEWSTPPISFCPWQLGFVGGGVQLSKGIAIVDSKGILSPDPGNHAELGPAVANSRGRIFVDSSHAPGTSGTLLLGTPGRQAVKLEVIVDLPSGMNPAQCSVLWSVRDPDDGSSADGIWLDSQSGPDNTGEQHEGSPSGHWLVEADHPLHGPTLNYPAGSEFLESQRTQISPHASSQQNRSSIQFYASDDGGDNFVIEAELRGPQNQLLGTCATKELVVWRFREVRSFIMVGAPAMSASVTTAAELLRPAFIEVQVAPQAVPIPAQDIPRDRDHDWRAFRLWWRENIPQPVQPTGFDLLIVPEGTLPPNIKGLTIDDHILVAGTTRPSGCRTLTPTTTILHELGHALISGTGAAYGGPDDCGYMFHCEHTSGQACAFQSTVPVSPGCSKGCQFDCANVEQALCSRHVSLLRDGLVTARDVLSGEIQGVDSPLGQRRW